MPLIRPSDRLYISVSKRYKLDDIVVFKKDNLLIAHRIVYIHKKGVFITKGDNNKKSDGVILQKNIIGKVDKIKRAGENIKLNHIYLSQSLTYLKEIYKIHSRLKMERINYVILKGLPIHVYVNRTPPNRLYLDIDILIRESNYEKVLRALSLEGYEKQESKIFGKNVRNATQVGLVKRTVPFPVVLDIHLEPAIGFTRKKELNKLLPNYTDYKNYLFSQKSPMNLGQTKVPIIKSEVLLTYLLLHFFHHNLQGAHRANLIKDLIAKGGISWKKFSKISQRFNIDNFILLSLECLITKFNLEISDHQFEIPKNKIRTFVVSSINPFNMSGRYLEAMKRLILVFLFSPLTFSKKISVIASKILS